MSKLFHAYSLDSFKNYYLLMPIGVCNPTETFEVFNNFQNVNNGVTNPVMLIESQFLYFTIKQSNTA